MNKLEKEMSLLDHLTELRRRLIIVIAVLFFGMILGLFVAQPVYQYLVSAETARNLVFHVFSFWDGIGLYMKIAMVVAFALTLPCALFQLWAFVSPGLLPKERRTALRYIPFVFLMFIIGVLFAYYVVFPMALTFTSQVTRSMGLEETYGVVQYFTFMSNIVFPVAALFELPLVIMFLTTLRIVSPALLRKLRRIAYFVLVFIAVVVTPPDFISDILVAIPLLGLYELSVFLSSIVYRKQQARDREHLEE
ncbi:twin-arginine translocase subunit TatC [Paenibacillus hunanensis]|uniref:Sec-independent protein translocase protein TatC n=1 Tax=Paenibacillus hunanensis TaxID=539262 RepID=A0ABU1IVX8_9BACL|nr:twin-arginine translocase subunit TatC [Paenibacillus hunanensis]MCL9659370.1 twin-arginine translocase subunit TatC [Paenibacillus hunanensis]MDR6243388.1 sec-independent protein translocase protein TatC [Paenibacillus hunanensis]WPP40404.1 twin-arginine translocase subunit TatC [Paenibacillus hunanensis]GGI97306.1 Sec-independent protein translocase protein TatCy [Paenibacillus hunanensis]